MSALWVNAGTPTDESKIKEGGNATQIGVAALLIVANRHSPI